MVAPGEARLARRPYRWDVRSVPRPAWIGLALLLVACGGEEAADAGRRDAAVTDAGGRDAGEGMDAGDVDGAAPTDAGPPPGGDAGPEPTETIWPVPGEVTIIQLQLPGVFRLGEAAVLVGPDGTLVLMDIGNSSHDDEVRELVRALNTSWVTPARGFPRDREPLEVEWAVISHVHADHVGAFADLFEGSEPITLTRGLVHRGFVDVGAAMNEGDYQAMCDALRGSMAALDVPLCTADPAAPCDPASFAGAHPATACDGLFLGDLDDALDDPMGRPSFLPLGGGARMVFVAADAFVSDGAGATPLAAFGHSDSNEENARSLVAIVEHGRFRYHWGGDLTGSGEPTEPDVESHLVATAADPFYGPLGMDVVHAHHHVRDTSSNLAFVEMVTPADGRSRNVIGGINGGHVGSPHGDVLARFGDDGRLGDGNVWITESAAGGDSHPTLIEADANVVLQTWGSGAGYRIQAARERPLSEPFEAVR